MPVSRTQTTASSFLGSDLHLDAAAGIGVLHGVHEKIGDDLLHARGVHLDRGRLQPERDLVMIEPSGHPQRLDGSLDDVAQVDRDAGEGNPTGGHPGDVEQVVDHAGEMGRLADEHAAGADRSIVSETDGLQQVGSGGDGAQRIA